MTATPSQADPVTGEPLTQVGGEAHGEAHGELRCVDCPANSFELFPVQSLPFYAIAGIGIGLLVIGVTALRRRRRRAS